jgi:hypothetical protein
MEHLINYGQNIEFWTFWKCPQIQKSAAHQRSYVPEKEKETEIFY